MRAPLSGPGGSGAAPDGLSCRRLAVLGPRLFDFVPLLRDVDPEVMIACEGGPDAEGLAARAGARLCSAETLTDRRSHWVNADVDGLALLAGGLTGPAAAADRDRGRGDRPLTVLAYGATPGWEGAATASEGRMMLVAPASALKDRLDDKIETRAQLGRLGVPTPRHARVAGAGLEFAALAHRFGSPFVLQEPVGASGVGTFEVGDPSGLEPVRRRALSVPWWLVSTRLTGPVVNIHGLVGRGGVALSPPSVQLSGVPELSVTSSSYNGNDFGAAADLAPGVVASVDRNAAEIGRWLATLGYLGVFGVDFVAVGPEAYALEVNPRLQGSTWLLGEVERRAGRTPMMIRHFLELLGTPSSSPAATFVAGRRESSGGANLVVRWRGPSAIRIDGHPLPGVHAVGPGGALEYRRPAMGLLECTGDEVLVHGLPPSPRAVVEPSAPLARVASWRRLAAPDGRSLTGYGRAVVDAVAGAFGGLPEPGGR